MLYVNFPFQGLHSLFGKPVAWHGTKLKSLFSLAFSTNLAAGVIPIAYMAKPSLVSCLLKATASVNPIVCSALLKWLSAFVRFAWNVAPGNFFTKHLYTEFTLKEV